jgi:hypothetical protein
VSDGKKNSGTKKRRKNLQEGLKMKKTTVVLLAALSTVAWGEEKVVQEADKTVYRKNTVVDFGDVNVEGELTKPEGSYVIDRQNTAFPSRIKIRSSFAPELQKSVDNL